jgi:hypothetical protein
VPGVASLDLGEMRDRDLEALAEVEARLEALTLGFATGRREPDPDQAAAAAARVEELLKAAFRARQWPRVTVLARGDGKASPDDWLGRERARAVVESLVKAGVDARVLAAESAPEGEPGTAVFRVKLEDLPRPR